MARRLGPRSGTMSGRQRLEGRTGLGREMRGRRATSPGRALVLLIVVGGLVLAGFLSFLGPALGRVAFDVASSNPEALRLPFVADVVRDRLGDRLTRPAGDDPLPLRFTIAPGASAREIGRALAEQGLVADELVFHYLVVTRGVGGTLEAGTYRLDRTMTPEQILAALMSGPQRDRTIAVQLREGLRIEQITAYLQTLPLETDAEQFYRLATRPPADLRAEYAFLKSLPRGRSLEGYLGAGTFNVLPTISARDLLRALLDRWEETVGREALARARAERRDFYEVLVLASIVEREVAVEKERRLVAGVYENRLSRGMGLFADPTVFYAYDTIQLRQLEIHEWPRYAFWTPSGLRLADHVLTRDLQGFQTYQRRGLPPWPICSPSLASIEAALDPDTESGYLYFVSKNDASHSHAFARTLEEHQANVRRYQKTR